MPIFCCEKCGCIENTATSRYYAKFEKICSACDPKIGQWHNIFEKRSAKGMLIGSDGFLYSKGENPTHCVIVGEVITQETTMTNSYHVYLIQRILELRYQNLNRVR